VYITLKDYVINEVLFTAHYKTDANNRFDLRLRNADLDLAQENGRPFPEEAYDMAQDRARHALQYLGSTALDEFSPDLRAVDVDKRPEAIICVFGNVTMRYKGKDIIPNFVTKKDVGSHEEHGGNVFAAILGKTRDGSYQVVTIMVWPRSTKNGRMYQNVHQPEMVLALTTGKKLNPEGVSRPEIVIDLDATDAEFNRAFPGHFTHGKNNAHFHTPEQQKAFDDNLAAEAQAARHKEQAEAAAKLAELAKEEKPAGREMSVGVGGTFLYARYQGDHIVAREYVALGFYFKGAKGFDASMLKPNAHVKSGETFCIQAKLASPQAGEEGLKFMLPFELKSHEYIIRQSDGSTFYTPLKSISRSRDDGSRMIFVGEKLQRKAADNKGVTDGAIVTGIKVKKPAAVAAPAR
jgi:hypothetical protein